MVADLAIIVVFIACTSKHSSDIRQHIARKVKTGAPAKVAARSQVILLRFGQTVGAEMAADAAVINNDQQVCNRLDAILGKKSRKNEGRSLNALKQRALLLLPSLAQTVNILVGMLVRPDVAAGAL
jgi:hypothetical protein